MILKLPRPALLIPILLVVAAVAFFGARALLGAKVRAVEVGRGDLVQTVVSTGRVITPARVEIGSVVLGTVRTVETKEGTVVKAGQVMARLKDEEQRAAVEQARGALAEAEARLTQFARLSAPSSEQALKQADANLEYADEEYKRVKSLFDKGYFSQAKLDEAERNLGVAKAARENALLQATSNSPKGSDYALAIARRDQARAALEVAQARLDNTVIKAPAPGTVLKRLMEPGDVVQQGKKLFELSVTGETQVVLNVDEKNIGLLALGQTGAGRRRRIPRPQLRRRGLLHRARHRRAARDGRSQAARARAARVRASGHDGVGRDPRREAPNTTDARQRRDPRRRGPGALGAGRPRRGAWSASRSGSESAARGTPRSWTGSPRARPSCCRRRRRCARGSAHAPTRLKRRRSRSCAARISSSSRRMPFELIVALRFLREGRMQTALILGGVAIGVAVVVFITGLVHGLQASLVERTLGSQAHIVIRPPEEKTQPVVDRNASDVAARIEARPQRLRSIDQWESLLPAVVRTPGVVAASPMATGAAFAQRGTASKSVALRGVDPERYRADRPHQRGHGARASSGCRGTDGVIGIELAKDLGVAVGDRIRIGTAGGSRGSDHGRGHLRPRQQGPQPALGVRDAEARPDAARPSRWRLHDRADGDARSSVPRRSPRASSARPGCWRTAG